MEDQFLHRFTANTVAAQLGSYGDPAAVPYRVWKPLGDVSSGRTGYTHQWQTGRFWRFREWLMASVETRRDAQYAHWRGWRTFRTLLDVNELAQGEILCPASDEAGKRRQCENCLACNGGSPATRIDRDRSSWRKSYGLQLPQACELSANIRTPQELISLRGSLRSWGCPPGLLFGVSNCQCADRKTDTAKRTYATKEIRENSRDIFRRDSPEFAPDSAPIEHPPRCSRVAPGACVAAWQTRSQENSENFSAVRIQISESRTSEVALLPTRWMDGGDVTRRTLRLGQFPSQALRSESTSLCNSNPCPVPWGQVPRAPSDSCFGRTDGSLADRGAQNLAACSACRSRWIPGAGDHLGKHATNKRVFTLRPQYPCWGKRAANWRVPKTISFNELMGF